MGPIGMQEMMLIGVLALLLFGPKKLPELGRMLGKGLSEFRRAKNELKATFETHLHELERETRLEDETKNSSYNPAPQQYTHTYDEQGTVDEHMGYGSSTDYRETPENEGASSYPTEAAGPEAPAPAAEPVPPVAGTVPRTNGTRPLEPVSPAVKEEHSA
jgi:sec-independent protein translocase protein TatA